MGVKRPTNTLQAKDKEQAVLHLYRIYQLEEVIHENLRPEKSQEIQKAGGKRKSYDLADDGEPPEDNRSATKKQRRKKTKKEAIRSTEPTVVEVGKDMNIEGDKAGPPLEEGEQVIALVPAPGRDGGVEGRKPKATFTGRNRRKRELAADAEASGVKVPKLSRRGVRPDTAREFREESESSRIGKGRKRRKSDS